MPLNRESILYLSANAMARIENKSLKKWCEERGIVYTTICKFSQARYTKLSSSEKVLIELFNNKNPKVYEYKERLFQMV